MKEIRHFDWIIIGSGFGGSVSALRLVEKGYNVLMLEKGRRFQKEDFPKTNWNLRDWMWNPSVGLRGIFKMSFFKHVTVLSGVGVGGGSLVYANTLPTPTDEFFNADSWSHLADWKEELAPHYETASKMLGATENPFQTYGDRILEEIAKDLGREEHIHPTKVAVFFGEPDKEVEDPYFEGEGPSRIGCTFCGACMTGCRTGAKNTLDRNYLYLAEKQGLELLAEREVISVEPQENGGYKVVATDAFGMFKKSYSFTANKVIFAGGVLGTVPLLLEMKKHDHYLPNLSKHLGDFVRTNSEALLGIVAPQSKEEFHKGIAITSIFHPDEYSHIEPVRYGAGSDFFRLLSLPHAPGENIFSRVFGSFKEFFKRPALLLRAFFVRDFAKKSQILLYMRTLEGTLSFRLGRSIMTGFSKGLVTTLEDPKAAPKAFMEEATDLAERFAEKINGVPVGLLTETFLGVPSTAHILGGCVMGDDEQTGVIDSKHRIFGYDGLYIIDGSAMSANPGVNPSLTITALAERAMQFIPKKSELSSNR